MSLELNKLNNFETRQGPVLLIIMDGMGIGKQDESTLDLSHLAAYGAF